MLSLSFDLVSRASSRAAAILRVGKPRRVGSFPCSVNYELGQIKPCPFPAFNDRWHGYFNFRLDSATNREPRGGLRWTGHYRRTDRLSALAKVLPPTNAQLCQWIRFRVSLDNADEQRDSEESSPGTHVCTYVCTRGNYWGWRTAVTAAVNWNFPRSLKKYLAS